MNHIFLSKRLRVIACSLIISLLCILMQGCVKHTYKSEPINTDSVLNEINSWSIDNPGLNKFLESIGLSREILNTNVFSIKRLYLTGLYFDPDMQVAYKKWKKAHIATDRSNYKINPEFSIPFEHHSDTSDGQSEWTIGAVLSFIYERRDKREARYAKAEINLLNARLEMTRVAHERYGSIEEKYHAYVVTQAKIAETENEIKVLKELSEQLQKKYELGAVSQFELSTINLEMQQRLFQLSLQESSLQENKDNLLAMTNLAYSEFDEIEIEHIHPIVFTKEVYQNTEFLEADTASLQKKMLDNNFEMTLELNSYAQSESDLRLEIEKQYPDLVLSPGFIFDQSDNIWALGTSWILPLFDNSKQNLEILKSLEDRKIKQQEIVALQKMLLNSLYQKHKSILRHKRTIKVSDEIIESIEQRAEELKKQIEMGGIDRVVMLRNRMEFYKAKQVQTGIYSEAINAMLEFEHLFQSSHSDIDVNKIVASWLENAEEKNRNEPVN